MPERYIDALNVPQAPDDIRFQFEIIKGLAESVREQTRAILRMQEQQTDIVARLERIESKETAEQLALVIKRVELLETSEHRREGAASIVQNVLKSPVFGWVVGAALTVWGILSGKVHIP